MGKPIAVVTGGAGFIGSHMVDLLLNEGFKVRVIDNLVGGRVENLEHHKGNGDLSFEQIDIRQIEPTSGLFKDAKYVYHFAGIGDIVPSIERPTEYMDVNVQGTVIVLEAARENKIEKLVYASSSSCYGLAEQVPTSEAAPINTEYPYALSKYLGEQAVFHWHRCYKLPVNAVCIFNAYGLRSKTSGAYGAVFGVFLRQKIAGKPFTVVGDGTQKRDFVYVSDVANAFYLASTTDICGERFNLGAGDPQPVNRLVELLGGEVVYIPKRPGEPEATHANITKITEQLGWKQKISFEEGVGLMLDNIDYWKNAPLWDQESIDKATKTWFKYLS